MYEFWYDYLKPNYNGNAKLSYVDTDSFCYMDSFCYIFTEDFFEDINNDVERWFDTSNYDKNDKRPLLMGKNEKIIGMFKDELGGKIMKEFCTPRAKTYVSLMDDDIEKKKAKGTKKCIIKRRLTFKNYKESIFENKTTLRSQLRFESDLHIVHTEEINKIVISSNDNERLQIFDKVRTYPYGINAYKVRKSEMMALKNMNK